MRSSPSLANGGLLGSISGSAGPTERPVPAIAQPGLVAPSVPEGASIDDSTAQRVRIVFALGIVNLFLAAAAAVIATLPAVR